MARHVHLSSGERLRRRPEEHLVHDIEMEATLANPISNKHDKTPQRHSNKFCSSIRYVRNNDMGWHTRMNVSAICHDALSKVMPVLNMPNMNVRRGIVGNSSTLPSCGKETEASETSA